MNFDVVIPWRATVDREPLLAYVLDRWRHAGVEPTVAEHDGGAWCKARAVTPAVTLATSAVVVVADADVWCDGIDAAVRSVVDGTTWAVPHLEVRRFTADATAAVFSGRSLEDISDFAERPYRGFAGGGIVVIRRDVYLDCPLDPRFVGWGQEDVSWARALTILHGRPWRGELPLYHLWHLPQPRHSRVIGSTAGAALERRYRAAARAPTLMRALIEEAKHVDPARHDDDQRAATAR